MKRIIDKNHFFSLERVILPETTVADSKCDLIRYTRFPEKQTELKGAISDISYTYWTSLQPEETDIFNSFSKTIRYEIRRSEKDAINIHVYNAKDCIRMLDDFKATYMHFCEQCNNDELKHIYDDALIRTYIDNGCFFLSVAEFDKGKVYHAYIYDESNACLWYSASDFRNPNVDRNLAARANKRLHFEDIKYFKEMGLQRYDWGNISSRNNENPNGIDYFKASFGGTYAEVYCYTVGNTFLGKVLVLAKKMASREKKLG
jgi:lipid II:glycine glycyltransferase (peptidoglycan interpeptide bridge formation enzyme)